MTSASTNYRWQSSASTTTDNILVCKWQSASDNLVDWKINWTETVKPVKPTLKHKNWINRQLKKMGR